MPTARPFAYNPGSPIAGTEQVGDIAVGITPQNYSGGYGGVRWWNGADEDLGYIICYSVPTEDHPSPDGPIAGVGFFRSKFLTEPSFIEIAEYVSNGQTFATGNDAKTWLNSNGYWTSWPEPVTGYSFNLVALPYSFPEAGNSIMNNPVDNTSGSTEINLLSTTGRGFYFNSIDSSSVDRTNYYSGFTGQSITITFSQTGNTAIYSGDTNSFKYWVQSPYGSGFVFGTGIGVPPNNIPSGTAVLIQSATTQFTIGLPVFVSLVEN